MHSVTEGKLSPLFRLAIKSGAPDAVALHLKRGEPANGRDDSGMTPLMIAAVTGRLEVCGALLQGGADRGRVNHAGKTASDLAREHGHELLGKFLFPVQVVESPPLPVAVPYDEVVASFAVDAEIAEAIDWQPDPVPLLPLVFPAPVPEVVLVQPAPSPIHPTPQLPSEIEIFAEVADGAQDAPLATSELPSQSPAAHEEPLDEMYGWVINGAEVVPAHDASCVQAALKVQRSISLHRRAKADYDWSDIEFELPDPPSRPAAHEQEELAQVGRLISAGLKDGRVSLLDIDLAIEADGGRDDQRTRAVVKRILADLGIQFEDDAFLLGGEASGEQSDELADSLAMVVADMAEPPSIADRYLVEARQRDLIDRDGEERLGRRMDTALAALARALVLLPEPIWERIFQSQRAPPAAMSDEDEIDPEDDEGLPLATAHEFESDPVAQPGVFRNYVSRLRAGAPECGRDTAVPRPDPATLTFFECVARDLDSNSGRDIGGAIKAYFAARDQLVTANLRLVVSNAQVYRHSGLPLEDLIQNGNIGLIRAAERYDFRKGFKFSTFATWWIRQGITRGVMDTVRLIRLPVHVGEKISSIERLRRENERGNARPMSAAEIASKLSLSERAVQRLLRANMKIVSLDDCGTSAEPDTPDPLTIPDGGTDPAQAASNRNLSRLISRLMADFPSRERTVISVRFGLDGSDAMTLEETGKRFNVTRERIRQIESTIVRKLRHPNRIAALAPFEFSTLLSEN